MLVSVIIPVKNGLKWLSHSLPIFLSQKIQGDFEIIFLDSGSTDGLYEYLKKCNYNNVSYIEISPATFNHGLTRNIGVSHAKGEYVVFTVQDAKPVDVNWLQHLLHGFIDEEIVAVCGQQIVPHNLNNNPVMWFRPVHSPSIRKVKLNPSELSQISPNLLKQYASWDNVVSCYFKEQLIKYPFKKTSFSEDLEWAKDALLRGQALVYNTNARVEHYHFGHPDYVYNRYMAEVLSKYRIFGVMPQRPLLTLKQFSSWCKILFMNSQIPFFKKLFWLGHNFNIYRNEKRAYKTFKLLFQNGQIDKLFEIYNANIPIGDRNLYV